MGLRRELKRVFRRSRPPREAQALVMPPEDELRRMGFHVPNFFIAGAARCGTTSLWAYLRQHPDVFMPPAFEFKEPSYFCDLYGMKNWREYLALFSEATGRKRIGEASGAYLTAPESAGRIRSAFPQARFIISLRNPAERAYSLYKWMHANGYEPIPVFEDALKAEEDSRLANKDFIRNNGENYYNFLYFHSGLYVEQLRRFYEAFGTGQVHVILFEEFIARPAAHMQRVFEFLDVNASFVPHVEVHNPSASSYGQCDAATRRNLIERYRPSVMQLESLLNRDLQRLWS
jgi:hypothetical protein